MSDFCDLVVIGSGAAGVQAAELAASLGLRAAVVDHRAGGPPPIDLPATLAALRSAAGAAHAARHADRYGLGRAELAVDAHPVWRRAREVGAEIVRHDLDPARLTALGIELVTGRARITGPNEVTVDEGRLITTRFVLVCPPRRSAAAEGTRSPAWLFEADEPPPAIGLVGGDGRLVLALAQACVRLGVPARVWPAAAALPHDEPSLGAALVGLLSDEGVVFADADVHLAGVAIDAREVADTGDLGLDELGIPTDDDGAPLVDERSRTAVRTVYAVDAASGHAAVRAVRDMFFPGRVAAVDVVPWCTFTDPELAGVGLTSADAEARHGDDVDVWRIELDRNVRARADATTEGALVIVTARDRIVGAHALAPSAGDLIHELALAMHRTMKLADLAGIAHVAPTIGASIGMLADESLHERAHRLRWLVRRR